jgi:hypothetical protein
MDEARIDHRRIAAGCVAVIALLGAAFALGRCSAPAEAQETQPAPTADAFLVLGNDGTIDAQAAIAEALTALTTTTTTLYVQQSAAAPQAGPAAPATPSGDRWDQLAQCETGGNWSANTGNGFGGGLQFMHQRSYSTWLSFGGAEFAPHPWEASREQQIDIAERVLAISGWRAWPGCARKNGWL